MLWIKNSEIWINEDKEEPSRRPFQKAMEFTWGGWIFKIYMPVLALVILPPATGGYVAYYTPPKGVGCRCVTLMIYASCQVAVTTIALLRCAVEDDKDHYLCLRKLLTGWRFRAILSIFWIESLIAAVAGTTMQITGAFQNCVSKRKLLSDPGSCLESSHASFILAVFDIAPNLSTPV